MTRLEKQAQFGKAVTDELQSVLSAFPPANKTERQVQDSIVGLYQLLRSPIYPKRTLPELIRRLRRSIQTGDAVCVSGVLAHKTARKEVPVLVSAAQQLRKSGAKLDLKLWLVYWPYADEESGLRSLAKLTNDPDLSTEVLTKVADNTRRYLQEHGESTELLEVIDTKLNRQDTNFVEPQEFASVGTRLAGAFWQGDNRLVNRYRFYEGRRSLRNHGPEQVGIDTTARAVVGNRFESLLVAGSLGILFTSEMDGRLVRDYGVKQGFILNLDPAKANLEVNA